jgi:hypothetical protein
LTYVTGDLLNITGVVGSAIIEYSQRGTVTVEDLKSIQEPMDSLFKLTRQIERYRSLEHRIEETRSKAKSNDEAGHRGRRSGASIFGARVHGRLQT